MGRSDGRSDCIVAQFLGQESVSSFGGTKTTSHGDDDVDDEENNIYAEIGAQ